MGIGDKIRQTRKQAGLTHEQLARLADVPVRQVYRWEAGTDPSVANLARVAAALGKSLDFFAPPTKRTKATLSIERTRMLMLPEPRP